MIMQVTASTAVRPMTNARHRPVAGVMS